MKKITAFFLCALMLLSVFGCAKPAETPMGEAPEQTAKQWIQEQIEKNTLFSFSYDDTPYEEHIRKWNKTVEETESGWTVTYKKDGVVAWSEITFDEESAALEWTNYFKNEGSTDSPVIQDILAIDSCVVIANPIFTTTEGNDALPTDFQPFSVDLVEKGSYSMETNGGRSSQGAWPYFDICNGEYGIMGAVGWTGNWKADFTHDNGKVTIQAGMQQTQISLHAGEQMRTPMIMLQFFKGDQDDGHNALRRLILKSYTPADASGEPIQHAMYAVGVSNMVGYGEQEILKMAKDLSATGNKYECLWLDAGWFGDKSGDTLSGGWYEQTGNWYFIKDVYPNGNIRELGEYLAEQNVGLLLWFEPERAMPGTQLPTEHPEWFLKSSQSEAAFLLFNMADDEACDYMIDWVSSTIQENHLTWYRQDFNCDPAERWFANDRAEGENRIGMTEIKYITNLYRYLDTLMERNPGLLIDSCASGGRRLDLEMMRRSIPLWNSDYVNYDSTPDGLRANNYNLSWWIPIHAGGWPWKNSEDTAYAFRASMNSGMQLGPTQTGNKRIQEMIEQYFICRDLMNGDYYMLAGGTDSGIETKTACYEFYKPEEGKGYLVAFRPERCDTESEAYYLKGLEAAASYEVELVDSGEKLTLTGQELMDEGLRINYPKPNIALLIYLTKI